MSAALWIYDTDGGVRFGPETSNGIIVGVHVTGKANGSITDPRLAKGQPFIASVMATEGTSFTVPKVTTSGTTISWAFRQDNVNWNQPVRITYGWRP